MNQTKKLAKDRDISAYELPATTTLDALLSQGNKHLFRQTLYDLDKLARALIEARKMLGSTLGITAPQYTILMIIAEHPGLAVRDVASRIDVSGAFATTEINNLVQLGLVEKLQANHDGRIVCLHLTSKGADKIDALIPRLRKFNDGLFQQVSAEEFEILTILVARILRNCHHGMQDFRRDDFDLPSFDNIDEPTE